MNIIGNNIRKLRQKRNLTQSKMADKLGLSIMAFSKIERWITGININRLKLISEFLEVSLEEILYDELEEEKSKRKQLKVQIEEYDQEIAELREKLIHLYEELHAIS